MFKVFLVVLATSGYMQHSQGKAIDVIQMETMQQCEALKRSVYNMSEAGMGHNNFKVKCVKVKEQTK